MSVSRFCENCGATLAADARFCEACGRTVSALSAPAMSQVAVPSSATPRPSQPRWRIAGCATAVVLIACVAVIAVGGFFFWQNSAQAPITSIPIAITSPSLPTLPTNTQALAPTPARVATKPAAELSATLAPVPSALPAIGVATPMIPTVAPTTKSQPIYSSVTFSGAFDQSALAPVNPGKLFPYGAKIVYTYWTYSGVVPNTPFEYEWTKNGVRLDSNGENFSQVSGKSFQWILHPDSPYTPKIPLDPGSYQFVVRVNGQVILSDAFTIQMPANTIIVFFAIVNNAPTGYVIDKQGVKHTPPGYLTISGFHVAPGDRIVIQTDQPRFSLLFDCGTSPKTFTPCDFVADTPAGLPAEFRKNANGTAYLNISRADNWAGTRPGFPSQRYPADPILRIGLGD